MKFYFSVSGELAERFIEKFVEKCSIGEKIKNFD